MTKIMEKPILSFIIVLLATFIIGSILEVFFKSIFGIFTPELAGYLGLIVSGIIIAILYVYIIKIKKFFTFSNFKLALILICPLFIFVLSNILDPGFAVPTTGIVVASVIISGFAPGIYEEVFFRGIVISYLMKFFRSSKNILPIVLFSALLFGAVHLFNGIVGAPMDMTIFQAFYAFSMGVLVAGVYLRTGNLWVPIILHALNDILALCSTSISKGIMQVGFVLDISNVIVIIASIICIVLGFYYVRSSKHDEIIAVWDEKWA